MKKIVAMVIISLFVMTSFAALPCISATITADKSDETTALDQDETYSITRLTRGNPPLPPVMWTENFSTFYISTPQEPDGDNVYYYIDWGDGTSSGWIGPYELGETVCISHVWSDEGTYQIKAKAKDQDGKSKCTVYSLTLSSDLNFFGVEIGYASITYIFTIYWKDCEYYIFIDWGDGNGEWIGPYAGPVLFSHTWNSPGEYVLRLKMKDIYGNESDWLTLIITILPLGNNAPDKPIIYGPTSIKPRTEYTFTAIAIDPDGDNISYFFDWGDGTSSDWTEFVPSGVSVNCSHIWWIRRCYTVSVKAKDIYGAESGWGTLKVKAPVNQPSSQQSSTGSSIQNIMSVIPSSITIINNGSLSGYVNDTSGNPMEGALVRVYFHETYEEDYSNSMGYYHVTNIPICYCLKNATCSKEGCKTEWVLLGITENTTFDFVLYPLELYPVFNGTMGWNGWWVGLVAVSFVFDPEEVAEIWYNYYGWHLYTAPFVVDEEGDDIPIDYYWVNYEGKQSPITTFYLDIDQTPPVTDLTWLVHKVGFKWYVRFILTAEDAISGMSPWLVIYINDLLLGEFEVLDWPTAEFEIQWFKAFKTVKFGFGCYDNAGNLVIESVNGSDIKSYSRNQNSISYQSNNMWLLRFLERYPLLQKLPLLIIK